ncbi:MAG TPA: hypothetical protein VL403_16900, partial [Candidatus Kryptonia bacterium]|nr:hypothetical protein [Candidatus Kryptonia bacterium]
STCQDSLIGRIVVTAEGLQVDETFAQGLRPDDTLLQLNSHLLRSCADLTRAVAEAHERQLELLLLVRREHELRAVMLQAPVTAAAKPLAAAAAVAPPNPTPTAVAIAPTDVDPVREMLAQLRDFGGSLQASLPVLTSQPWARQVHELRSAYERRQQVTPAVQALAPILDDYQTVAEILVYKEDAVRALGNSRPRPNMTLRYNTGSQVTGWLRRHPFLQASVVEPPEQTTFAGWAEGNGLWSPDRAVALLVERALSDGDALARRLDSAKAP